MNPDTVFMKITDTAIVVILTLAQTPTNVPSFLKTSAVSFSVLEAPTQFNFKRVMTWPRATTRVSVKDMNNVSEYI